MIEVLVEGEAGSAGVDFCPASFDVAPYRPVDLVEANGPFQDLTVTRPFRSAVYWLET